MEGIRTSFNSDEVCSGKSYFNSPRKVSVVLAASVIVCAFFYTIITIIAVVVFEQKFHEVQKEQANINKRYQQLNKSNALTQENIQNITAMKNFPKFAPLVKAPTEKKKVEIKGCDTIMTINNKEFRVANSSFGAYTDQPCPTTGGYISVGCRYVCQSSGKWKMAQNRGSIKIFYRVTSWFHANTTCTSENATMLTIEDETHFNLIRQIVTPLVADIKFFISCGTTRSQFWIGANDLNSEGEFKWVNGDRYSFWHNQKQVKDNRGCDGNPADCALIIIDTGVWEDRKCDATLPFICQKF